MDDQPLRTLGLDIGDSRIGVAIGSQGGISIRPLEAINRTLLDQDIQSILQLIKEYDVRFVVVGLPISLNGRIGKQATKVKEFTRYLAKASPVAIYSQDERFSSVEAKRLLRDAGRRIFRNKGLLDSASAAVILRSYLDTYGVN